MSTAAYRLQENLVIYLCILDSLWKQKVSFVEIRAVSNQNGPII